MTNNWVDIRNADVVLVMGGNPAEAHPCGFKWVTEAKANNGAQLIVVDPRFTRTAAVADHYVAIRSGTDIAFLGGIINYLLTHGKVQHEYVKAYTNASFLVSERYAFHEGLFSGYDAARHSYAKDTWAYQTGADGYAKVDPTLSDPHCVFNLMKTHYARYTPEMVSEITGAPVDQFLRTCELIASTSAPNRAMTIMYAVGWTQHTVGSQIIRAAAMLQLLLGNVGLAGGGVNALRGHSNIQGLTDLGLLSNSLPGYLTLASDDETNYDAYIAKRAYEPSRPGQVSYWKNYGKFYVSLMKAWYGDSATAANDYCYDWMPKLDKLYDVLQVMELMSLGRMTGYVAQGFNPLASFPDKAKTIRALSNLDYLIVIDALETETSVFWQNHGEFNDVDPAAIKTEVFRLPSGCFAEDDGALVNSSRWLQWHWKAAPPPGEAKSDREIVAGIFLKLRELYRREGGAFPDPILHLTWPYAIPSAPSSEELAMEYTGRSLIDGKQLSGFAELADDGSTSCGCWLFAGAWSEEGNLMARRDNSDPSGLGEYLDWAYAWPANRRILYNRASCDPSGKPWDASRALISWNGTKWSGIDVPDFVPTSAPNAHAGPFIMLPEGAGRLFALGTMAEGPFPEHYEPFETPIGTNPLHPRVISNPAARIFKGDAARLGSAAEFPYVATTYRITEHFHFWTKHAQINSVLAPEQFVEIGDALAKEKGISDGDTVVVRSKRGEVKAIAVVTKRIKALQIAGKTVHTVGVPLHWGFTGVAKKGYLANALTPAVGDANAQTPEYKSFLVDVSKV